MTQTLETVGTWVLLSSFPAILLFVPLYARSRWRTTEAGRALMFQSSGMALVVTIVLLTGFLGFEYPGRPFVRIIGFSMLSIASWRLLITLVRVQHRGDVFRLIEQGKSHPVDPVQEDETPVKK